MIHVDSNKKLREGSSGNGNDSPLMKHHLKQQRKTKIIERCKPAARKGVRLRGHANYTSSNVNLIFDCKRKIDDEMVRGGRERYWVSGKDKRLVWGKT